MVHDKQTHPMRMLPTDLAAETSYELSTLTVDTHGNVNTTTWVNQTAKTSAPAANGAVSGTIYHVY